MRASARAATFTGMRPRPCSVRVRSTLRSCSLGNSRATRRTSPGGRSSARPAQLFDAALEKAGIDRSTVYVTNAVKHFKFVPRGKKRIHSKPGAGEIEACRWWIGQERELLRPPVTVALGATAAHSLFGKVMAIGKNRGAALLLPDGSECWITVHPSFLLRIPGEDRKREERALFVRDLKHIKARAEELAI